MAFPVNWQRKCALVIQHGQVNANQTAFPTLITEACLPSEMMTLGGANAAQSDGGDIRFSSDAAGATQLACEVVLWTQNANPALAKAEIWVPTAPSSSVDVTLYVWYSAGGGQTQPAANAAFGSQAVWDANYMPVVHYPDGAALSVADSTGKTVPVNHGATAAAGQIDGCAAFSGSNYVSIPIDLSGTAVITIEFWLKWTTFANNDALAFELTANGNTNNGAFICDPNESSSGKFQFQSSKFSGSATYWSDMFTRPSAGAWHHVVLVINRSTPANLAYVDGVAQTLSAGTHNASAMGNFANSTLYLFSRGGASLFGAGSLDEFRISSTTRVSGWVATSYNNQNSPSTFIIAGTPVSTLGGGGLLTMGCGS